jgi:hypothetical protein
MVDVSDNTLKTEGFFSTPEGKVIEIREVWALNLEYEMNIMLTSTHT